MSTPVKIQTEEAVKDEKGQELLLKKAALLRKIKESKEELSPFMEGLFCGPVLMSHLT